LDHAGDAREFRFVRRHPTTGEEGGHDRGAVAAVEQRMELVCGPPDDSMPGVGQRFMQDQLAKIGGKQAGFKRTDGTVGMPKQVHRITDRVHDCRDILNSRANA
jgi:hypothetical protein